MNEGFMSTRLGLPGLPKAMEEIRIDRNCRLAALTDSHVHIQHVSSAAGVAICRQAKAAGLPITCETAPHYWTLTDEAVMTHGANAKMNPPLREAADVEAVKEGLADGTIDCIATDHAPHTATEKDMEVQLAPFGIVGLETSLGLVLTELVEPGVITLEYALALMTNRGADILNLPAGRLYEGGPADLTVFDRAAEWTVDPAVFASLGRNTPFTGQTLRGQVRATMCDGRLAYQA